MRLNQYINEEKGDKSRWGDYVKKNPMLKTAVQILRTITKKGYKAYIVGGSVRDLYLGIDMHDVDIATNMPIIELEKIYKTYDIGKSKDFGIVVINQNGHSYEIAQFRQDGKYSDGRRPDSVKLTQDFKGDASRRDFSFNAMAVDADGNIIDYFDGKKDIKNKVVRTVGNPFDRFEEDYIRMMRAVRFSSKLGFDIEDETKEAIKANKDRLKDVSIERIQQEVLKMASQSGDKFADAILKLDEVGILEIILPEVVKLKQFSHDPKWHPEGNTPFSHTIEALRTNKLKDPILNLAILLHDIGKMKPSGKNPRGYDQFHGHAGEGKDIVDTIAKRLKLSNKDKNRIMFAVVNHMKVHKFPEMKPSKIIKLINDENWETLAAVTYADKSCRGAAFRKAEWQEVLDKIKKVEDKWGAKSAKIMVKIVDGNRVMTLTKLRPGKKVGDIIRKVTEFAINNNVKNQKEIDKLILKFYREGD